MFSLVLTPEVIQEFAIFLLAVNVVLLAILLVGWWICHSLTQAYRKYRSNAYKKKNPPKKLPRDYRPIGIPSPDYHRCSNCGHKEIHRKFYMPSSGLPR